MNTRLRKILEIVLVVCIVGLSVAIFLLRDRLQNISNVSYLGLFLLCFLANATVFLPAPSLMIAASCALIMNPLMVAVVSAAGSSLGELTGYVFGTAAKDLSPRLQKLLEKLTGKIHNQALLVFVFAVLPLPFFDIAGVYSGGTRMNLLKFFAVCFAGKFIKMLVYTRMYDIIDWASSLVPGLEGLL